MPAGRVLAATSLVMVATVGLTGCGSKKTTTSSSTSVATATSKSTTTSQASSSSMATSQASDSSTANSKATSSSSSKAAGTCSAKQTSATIGGVHKCIEAGQMCSEKHADDYTQYGFTCEQDGKSWVLKKKN